MGLCETLQSALLKVAEPCHFLIDFIQALCKHAMNFKGIKI